MCFFLFSQNSYMCFFLFSQTKTRVQHLQDQYRAIQQGITEFSVQGDTGAFGSAGSGTGFEDQTSSTRATVCLILHFIIYPSMYCSKYRPYRAVEYKRAGRIFRITTVRIIPV